MSKPSTRLSSIACSRSPTSECLASSYSGYAVGTISGWLTVSAASALVVFLLSNGRRLPSAFAAMIGRNAARALITAASAMTTLRSAIAARSLRVPASSTARSIVSPLTGGGGDGSSASATAAPTNDAPTATHATAA